MKINAETDILNLEFRQAVLKDIDSAENKARKTEAKRRYEVFKDQSKKYVLEAMAKESSDGKNIIPEIESRASGVSFCRKIIDKKATVYKNPVQREHVNQKELDFLSDYLEINTTMKKANKYVELFKNTLIHVFPWFDNTSKLYRLDLRVLAPDSYDVVEDMQNPEIARVVLYSYMIGTGNDGKPILNYIWWSDFYHFTTDKEGKIIQSLSPENLENPIGVLPFVDIAEDKDNCYWAQGGNDIIDCDILLNVGLTDLNYIIKYQSMGIFYLAGAGVPKEVKVGPSSMIVLDKRPDDPDMQIGFASSNPQIDAVLSSIEQYLNYVLSTNSLNPGTISGKVTANNASSGLQEIIQNADIIDDITDQQEIYRKAEPKLFEIIFKFINLYKEKNQLVMDFDDIGKIDDTKKVITKFSPPTIIQTEKDKLDIIKQRQEMGLDSELDSIMKDNPALTEEEAKAKLLEIKTEKIKNQITQLKNSIVMQPDNETANKEMMANGQQSNVQD